MATSFDPYVGGGEDLHASGGGSAFETEESYEPHLYTSEEKHRGLDIDDEDDREVKEGGAGGGSYGGASLTDGGNHGFDLDLGSEAPPSYRSPFDDDDDQDAGYVDGGIHFDISLSNRGITQISLLPSTMTIFLLLPTSMVKASLAAMAKLSHTVAR